MISKEKCFELLQKNFNSEEIAEYEKKIKTDYWKACAKYCKELSKVVKEYGLGEDIKVEIRHLLVEPNIIFKIQASYKMSWDEEKDYINKIQTHMSEFSKENDLYEFFMDSHILINNFNMEKVEQLASYYIFENPEYITSFLKEHECMFSLLDEIKPLLEDAFPTKKYHLRIVEDPEFDFTFLMVIIKLDPYDENLNDDLEKLDIVTSKSIPIERKHTDLNNFLIDVG